MYKREFIKKAAENAGMTQVDFENAYNAMIAIIEESLSNGKRVQLTGFGTFKTSERKARKGRNPATGAEIKIPARTAVTFSAGKGLKEAVDAKPAKPVKAVRKKKAKTAAVKA